MKDAAELTRLGQKIEKVRSAMQVPNISPFAKTRLAGRLDELIEQRDGYAALAATADTIPTGDALVIRSNPGTALIAAENHIHPMEKETPMPASPTEKERLAAIICAPIAASCPDLAKYLAFESTLSVEAALKAMTIAVANAERKSAPASLLGRLGIAPAAATAAPIVQPAPSHWDEIATHLNEELKRSNPSFVAPIVH